MDNAEFREQFKQRTRQFSLRVIRLVDALPRTRVGDVIGRQLLRSATSVGANYRSACRGRSTSEFVAKLGTVEEEADECVYWLELLADSGLVKSAKLAALLEEANEIVAIIVAAIKSTRRRSS